MEQVLQDRIIQPDVSQHCFLLSNSTTNKDYIRNVEQICKNI